MQNKELEVPSAPIFLMINFLSMGVYVDLKVSSSWLDTKVGPVNPLQSVHWKTSQYLSLSAAGYSI